MQFLAKVTVHRVLLCPYGALADLLQCAACPVAHTLPGVLVWVLQRQHDRGVGVPRQHNKGESENPCGARGRLVCPWPFSTEKDPKMGAAGGGKDQGCTRMSDPCFDFLQKSCLLIKCTPLSGEPQRLSHSFRYLRPPSGYLLYLFRIETTL